MMSEYAQTLLVPEGNHRQSLKTREMAGLFAGVPTGGGAKSVRITARIDAEVAVCVTPLFAVRCPFCPTSETLGLVGASDP